MSKHSVRAGSAAEESKSRPGLVTTEFWLSVSGVIAALVLSLADKISGEVAMGAITAGVGAYTVSRGIAKN